MGEERREREEGTRERREMRGRDKGEREWEVDKEMTENKRE